MLPNACATKLIVTFNAQPSQLFTLAAAAGAQWEIRALAEEMLKLCLAVAPTCLKVRAALRKRQMSKEK